MPSPKEKPKKAKAKKDRGKNVPRSQPAISAKQAAKLMKDKYVQQLDQRQFETGSDETLAVEQVERVETWVVDGVIFHEHPCSPRQRGEKIKERPQTTPERAEQPAPTTSTERSTDRPSPKVPTAKTEYAAPSPEGTIISRQNQAEIGALPKETVAGIAPEGSRLPRTKPTDIHSPESKIVPRQKQTAGIGTLPKETPARTVQEGGRLPRIRPAVIHDQEHKVSPYQKYTISPRQNASSPSRTNPVQRDGAIQPPQFRPPEQIEAPNSTTAISPQKLHR